MLLKRIIYYYNLPNCDLISISIGFVLEIGNLYNPHSCILFKTSSFQTMQPDMLDFK